MKEQIKKLYCHVLEKKTFPLNLVSYASRMGESQASNDKGSRGKHWRFQTSCLGQTERYAVSAEPR